LYKNLNLLKISEIYELELAKFMYSIIKNYQNRFMIVLLS